MVLGLGRRRQRRKAAEQQAEDDTAASGPLYESYPLSTALPLDVQLDVTDSVDLELGGQYPEVAVANVKQYERPPWRAEDSSLDPISDLEDYYQHDFKIPPDDYDRIIAAAAQEERDLERQRAPPPASLAERIKQRRRLVEGRSLEAVKLLKLKAYERGMAQIRAARDPNIGEPADAEVRAAYLQSKGAPLDVIPADLIDMAPAQFVSAAAERLRQQKQQEAARAVEATATAQAAQERYKGSPYADAGAANAGTSEWEAGWDAKGWGQSPQVQQTLAEALGSCFGTRDGGGSGSRDGGSGVSGSRVPQELYMVAEGEGRDGDDGYDVVGPYQAYTPEYEQLLAKRAALQRHQQQRARAFGVSLALVLGAGAAQWLLRRIVRRKRAKAGKPAAAAGDARVRQPVPS